MLALGAVLARLTLLDEANSVLVFAVLLHLASNVLGFPLVSSLELFLDHLESELLLG